MFLILTLRPNMLLLILTQQHLPLLIQRQQLQILMQRQQILPLHNLGIRRLQLMQFRRLRLFLRLTRLLFRLRECFTVLLSRPVTGVGVPTPPCPKA